MNPRIGACLAACMQLDDTLDEIAEMAGDRQLANEPEALIRRVAELVEAERDLLAVRAESQSVPDEQRSQRKRERIERAARRPA